MGICVRSIVVMAAVCSFNACGGDAARSTSSSAPPASTGATASTAATPEFGAVECDTYVKQYLACIDRMPEAARTQAREALEQSRASWKQAASTEQGRASLAATCKAASDAAAPAMRAQGCSW